MLKLKESLTKVFNDNKIVSFINSDGQQIDDIESLKHLVVSHYTNNLGRRKQLFKIKIVKCSSDNLWYARQIGSIMNATIGRKHFVGYEYKIIGGGYVRADDCEKLSEDGK